MLLHPLHDVGRQQAGIGVVVHHQYLGADIDAQVLADKVANALAQVGMLCHEVFVLRHTLLIVVYPFLRHHPDGIITHWIIYKSSIWQARSLYLQLVLQSCIITHEECLRRLVVF